MSWKSDDIDTARILINGSFDDILSADSPEQLLFLNKKPSINGLIVGEEYGSGSQRLMQPGRCYNFDGSDDYVDFGAGLLTTQSFSMSYWLYATTSGVNRGILGMGNAVNINGTGFQSFLNSGTQLTTYINSGGASTPYTFYSTVLHNTWNHIVVVIDRTASQATTWVNGVSGSIANISTVTGSIANGAFLLGRYASGYNFTGRIFDFQIIEEVLSSAGVNQLYTNRCNALPNSPRKLWAKCDDQYYITAFDSSGNGNNGKLTNVNATVGNFYYEGNDVPFSYQNDNGCTTIINHTSSSEDFSLTAPTEYYGYSCTTTAATEGWKIADSTTGTGYFNLSIAFTRTTGLWTTSVYVKAVEYSVVGICEPNSGRAWAWFNLSTGTVYSSGGPQLVPGSATITSAGDGWFRISISVLYQVSFSGSISMAPSTSNTAVYGGNYTGTVGSGVLVNKMQINNGLLQPYQKTSGYELYSKTATTNKLFLPRNESNKLKDVFGTTLQYSGKCPRNAKLVNSNCLTLDGTNDYVYLSSNVPVTGTNYTYAVIFYATVDTRTLGGKSGDANCYLAYYNTNLIYHKTASSGSNYAYIYSPTPILNSWKIVVVRRNGNGNNVDFFVDGNKLSSNYTGTLPNNTCDINLIGANGSGLYHSGSLSYLAAWNRSLSDSECSTIGISNFGPNDMAYGTMFSEGAGSKCYDISTNGLHGTITNANLVTAWATKQNVCNYNTSKGFTKYTHTSLDPVYVPYDVNMMSLIITPESGYSKYSENPAGSYHNLSESLIDLTQGVASPGSSSLSTNLNPTSSVSNPLFKRTRTKSGSNVAYDKILRYSQTVTGAISTAAGTFTTTKAL